MRLRAAATASMVLVLLIAGTAPATAATTCAPFGTVAVDGGRVIYQNNVWNSPQSQCASVDTTTGA